MRTQFSKLALVATFGLALAFTFSCSSGDDGGNPAPSGLRKEKISGVSQKGPFAQGAIVKVYELNTSTGEKGNPLPFDVTTDSSGNFKIENVTLASQYIVIEVSGKYFNEVSNKQTTAPITLRAVADVSGKDNVNINVFTHLEYDKVLKLAKGTEFGAAKKAAQKEVLNALGMSEVVKSSEDLSLFGGSKSDSLLLATSVLLQANRSPTEVSSLLDAIGGEIRDNGTLSGQTKTQVASGLAFLGENDNVGQNVLNLANNIVTGMNGSSSSGRNNGSSSSGGVGSNSGTGTFMDARDSKVYKWVKIGEQTWMAENLNHNANGSKCYGENGQVSTGSSTYTTLSNAEIQANCEKYGRLYDWVTAMDINAEYNTKMWGGNYIKHRGICPANWHIPSNSDWDTLMKFINPSCSNNRDCANVGTKLKAVSGWNNNRNGTDDYGFSALPGGHGGALGVSGNFDGVGDFGLWWSSYQYNDNRVYYRSMSNDYESVRYLNSEKFYMFSVRCLQDAAEAGGVDD